MDTIPNNAKIEVIRYTPDFSAICSVSNVPFHGNIEIVYRPSDILIEFISFEKWLVDISNNHMNIEDLARLVFDELTVILGEIPLCVTVHAKTIVHAPVSATIERE